ncbi:MAG: hypothetical protein HYX65_05690 [Gemmatimonadetes bacterium]|nr:hypothetical protein [Gemmatimonadota bacterium]
MRRGLALIEVLAACSVLAAGLLVVARVTGEAARLAAVARADARAVDRADSLVADAALRPCADATGDTTVRVDLRRRLRTVRVTVTPATTLEATVPCRP